MLQQTQVATVIPYYNRWMEKYVWYNAVSSVLVNKCELTEMFCRFPTIRDLVGDIQLLFLGCG